jgi:four helix bundle protein
VVDEMNSKTEELLKRTFEFGVRCLIFLELLPKTKVNAVITYQLAKASTSIGSNYEEAQAAESSKDFIHKIGVVLKESRESNYWLRILDAILKKDYKNSEFEFLLKESSDFKKIYSSIKLTAQNNLKKQN